MRNGLLIVLFTVVAAQAELEWKQKDVFLQTHATQLSANAVFHFSNVGKTPVSISDIKVTCGCLSPRLTQRTYAPGESGELQIQLDLRNRAGKQRKATVVTTDEGKEVKLYVEADIPAGFIIEPRMVVWHKGDAEKNKTARLLNISKQPIKLLDLTSSHRDMPAELKTIREGFEYRVVITRTSEVSNLRSVIRIATEPPPGETESKTLKVYAHAQ
jgi:hypothetical protein